MAVTSSSSSGGLIWGTVRTTSASITPREASAAGWSSHRAAVAARRTARNRSDPGAAVTVERSTLLRSRWLRTSETASHAAAEARAFAESGTRPEAVRSV